MGKSKQPPPVDHVAEMRRDLREDPSIATTVYHHEDHRYTALHEVADRLYDLRVNLQLAALLLEHGADPNARTDLGWTPLHFACSNDSREIDMVELLLRNGADPNLADLRGDTPLHYVLPGIRQESKQIVELLLEHNAKVDLDAAASLGDVETVRQLLKRDGLTQARNSRDLLTNAIRIKSVACVELLLEYGADPNQSPSFSREPPLYTACQTFWANSDIVRLLLDYGADPNPKRYKPLTGALRKNPNMGEIVELLQRAGAR